MNTTILYKRSNELFIIKHRFGKFTTKTPWKQRGFVRPKVDINPKQITVFVSRRSGIIDLFRSLKMQQQLTNVLFELFHYEYCSRLLHCSTDMHLTHIEVLASCNDTLTLHEPLFCNINSINIWADMLLFRYFNFRL